MEECVFCNIRDRKIPANFEYEDEHVMAFPDIHPDKPVHMLIIPKKHIKEFLVLEEYHLFEKLGKVIQKLIIDKGLENKGYKILMNGGGHQDVDHLHIHLLGPMK